MNFGIASRLPSSILSVVNLQGNLHSSNFNFTSVLLGGRQLQNVHKRKTIKHLFIVIICSLYFSGYFGIARF